MKEWIISMFGKFIADLITDERLHEIKKNLVCYLATAIDDPNSEVDDLIVDVVARFLGVDAEECKAAARAYLAAKSA